MKRTIHLLAGAAIVASAAFLSQPASAIGLPGSPSMHDAIVNADVVDKVHCRPGRWHHRYRPHDGCYRRHRYYRDYDYYEPGVRAYGPGVGVYGPGVRFDLNVGPRRHRHW